MVTHDRVARAARRRAAQPARRAPAGHECRLWLLAIAMVAFCQAAEAHGIVGSRVFPGTLAFDDPAVMDELVFPAASSLKHPGEGADVVDNRIGWSFSRLLTSTLALEVDGGWIHRSWPRSERSGFDTTTLGLKGLLYKNDAHEVMISAGLGWGIGGSGARGVGARGSDTIEPGIFFGKGFGDLPAALSWLRPFAITGAVTAEHPMAGMSGILGVDPDTGQLGAMLGRNVDTLHWGFSIQYSTYYLTSRYTPGTLPRDEPLRQLIPLVEFAFDTPRGEKTAATMNPGFAYVADTWQVAVEAIVPLNSEGGRAVGARAHLFLFLDDLIPALFGKPLLEMGQARYEGRERR